MYLFSADFPTVPEVPAEQQATAQGSLRYEDVAQDGRLLLHSLPHFMGRSVFQGMMVRNEAARANAHAGIFPIITRLVVEGGDGPVSVRTRSPAPRGVPDRPHRSTIVG